MGEKGEKANDEGRMEEPASIVSGIGRWASRLPAKERRCKKKDKE